MVEVTDTYTQKHTLILAHVVSWYVCDDLCIIVTSGGDTIRALGGRETAERLEQAVLFAYTCMYSAFPKKKSLDAWEN